MMNNYKYGGGIENENAEMVMNNNNQIKHHTEELEKIVTPETEVPAWVVSKVGRSASDLSDATHYLDGVSKIKYADGGGVGDDLRKILNPNINEAINHFEHTSVIQQGSKLDLILRKKYGNFPQDLYIDIDGDNSFTLKFDDRADAFIVYDLTGFTYGRRFAKSKYADGGGVGTIKERVIDYYINNSDNEDLINLMGVSDMPNLKQMAEKWVNNRDTYYDKIFNAIDGIHNRAWGENKFVELGLEKFADGGSIPNNYDGKAVRHIWNSWSVSQRKHFLHDHSSEELQNSYGENYTTYLSEVEIENLAEVNYEDLPQDIKTKVFIHTDMGQYADGGGVNFGDGMTSESDGSPYNSIIIKAIQEWNDVADKEDEIGINSKERRIIISHFKNKNNYTIDDVLDWIANDLELDENYADGGGVGEPMIIVTPKYSLQSNNTNRLEYNELIEYLDNHGWMYEKNNWSSNDMELPIINIFINQRKEKSSTTLSDLKLWLSLKNWDYVNKYADGGGVGEVVKTVKGLSIKLNSDKDTKNFIKYVVVDSNGKEVMGFNLIQDAVSWIHSTYADGGVAYNPVWAEMEAYSPYSSRTEYENKKEYDDLAFASKSFSKSAEILVKENLMNGEICICKLRKILGHEPAYPVQYVGSIKLTKCFLKPFYKI